MEILYKKTYRFIHFKIVKAENGDAWVEANNEKFTFPEFFVFVPKMKETAEKYLGQEVTKASNYCTAYFNDFKDKQQKTQVKLPT